MNKSDRTKSTGSNTRPLPPPPRPVSTQEIVSEQPVGLEKLRNVNASIGADVLKQIAARTNNAEQQDSTMLKKRTVCNYCLIKSKHNLKGKCLQCSIPQAEVKPKKVGFSIFQQFNLFLQSSSEKQPAAIIPPQKITPKLSVLQTINELLFKLDEFLPKVQNRDDLNNDLASEVILQLSALIKKPDSKEIESQIQSVPITPITKPKNPRYRGGVSETPIKQTDLSRSLIKQDTSFEFKHPEPMNLFPMIFKQIRKWTEHFYSILETKAIPERDSPVFPEQLASYIDLMDIKFLKHATLIQELRQNVEVLNAKLIEYMEIASQNVSEKQIEDDLALVEKSSVLGIDLAKLQEDGLGKVFNRPLTTSASDDMLRMLLLQANSVEGLILQLDPDNSTSENFIV